MKKNRYIFFLINFKNRTIIFPNWKKNKSKKVGEVPYKNRYLSHRITAFHGYQNEKLIKKTDFMIFLLIFVENYL